MFPTTLYCPGCGNTTTSPHITHTFNAPPLGTCAHCHQAHPLRPPTPPSQNDQDDPTSQLLSDLFASSMILTPPQSPTATTPQKQPPSFAQSLSFSPPQTQQQQQPQQQPQQQRPPLTFASTHYIPTYASASRSAFESDILALALREQAQAAQAHQAQQDRARLDEALRSGSIYPLGPDGYDDAWARAHGVEYEQAWARSVGGSVVGGMQQEEEARREQRQREEEVQRRKQEEERRREWEEGGGMVDDGEDLQAQFLAEMEWRSAAAAQQQQQQQQQIQQQGKPPGIGVGDGFGVIRSIPTLERNEGVQGGFYNQNFYGGFVNGKEMDGMDDEEEESPCSVVQRGDYRCLVGGHWI